MRKFAWLCTLAIVLTAPVAGASQHFYAGKSVRIISPWGPGGGPDIGARLYARHLPKHTPGSPRFIVQNMLGAGGLIGANYLFNVAKPDGLTLGIMEFPLAYTQLAGEPGVQYDMARYRYIGALGVYRVLVFVRAALPYTTLDELRRAQEPLVAGTRRPGAVDFMGILALRALGVPLKIITGYAHGGEQAAALARGEMDIFASTPPLAVASGWLTPDGQPVAGAAARPIGYAGPNSPAFDYLPNFAQYKPSPDQEVAFRAAITTTFGHTRALAAPPGTPPKLVKKLRDAFRSMARDEEFLKEAERAGMEPEPADGDGVQQFVVKTVNDPMLKEAVPLLVRGDGKDSGVQR